MEQLPLDSSARPHRKRRKHLHENLNHPLVCAVCGAEAHGYNFDVITCDSCKVFFRRTAIQEPVEHSVDNLRQSCKLTNGHCTITKASRKRCSACRMRRCLEVGMKKEWITPVSQLKMRSNFRGRSAEPRGTCYTSSLQSSHSLSDRDQLQQDQSSSKSDDPHIPQPKSKATYTTVPDCSVARRQLTLSLSSLSDPITATYTQHLFTQYREQVGRVHSILMEPTTQDEFERYNLLDWNPTTTTMENTFNRREFGFRRLIRAVKEMPQFSLLSKETQVALVKETMRGVSTLFFLLHYKPDSNTAAFEYITREGELKFLHLNCKMVYLQGLYVIGPNNWPQLLSIFAPPDHLATTIEGDSVSLMDDESLQNFIDNFPMFPTLNLDEHYGDQQEIKREPNVETHSMQPTHHPLSHSQSMQFEMTVDQLKVYLEETMSSICQSTNCNGTLLTIACLLRMFRVDEASSRLPLSATDCYLIQRTRYELTWFLTQYAEYLWTSPSNTSESLPFNAVPLSERLLELSNIFHKLSKLEKFKLNLEFCMCREKLTPLMREFLPEGSAS